MQKKYTALRIISTVYKIIGGIAGVLTLLVALGLCVTSVAGGAAVDSLGQQFGGQGGIGGTFGGLVGGLILAIVAIIYGGGLALTLFAAGEGINLLIDLEENTRLTANLLNASREVPASK